LPNVTTPPAKFKIDPWYTKFTWAREFIVVGRGASDAALLKANDTVRKLFAYRHDVLKVFINEGTKLVVLGSGERMADLPELKALAGTNRIDLLSRTLDYSGELKLMAVAEENVLANPRSPNVGDYQILRVFARALHTACAGRPVDPNWERRGRDVQQYELRVKRLDVQFDERLKEIYEKTMAAGRWKGTAAIHDRVAYWVAGMLAYFDALGQDAAPNDAAHPVQTREALKAYDPDLFTLVHDTMAYEGRVDWRFKP
jgi:hypothetical protein